MIKVSILYPGSKETPFDMTYYLEQHMPLALSLLGNHQGYRGVTVAQGLDMGNPELELRYIVICEFLFDSGQAFMEAFTPHADTLEQDIANYTTSKPMVQFSEVRMCHPATASHP